MDISLFVFRGTSILFSTMHVSSPFSAMVWGSHFLCTVSLSILLFVDFLMVFLLVWVRHFHCNFDLHFYRLVRLLRIFCVFYACVNSLWINVCLDLCLFFFFKYLAHELFVLFGNSSLVRHIICKSFSPILRVMSFLFYFMVSLLCKYFCI